MDRLRLAFSVPLTEAEGPGRRFALWVQGCTLGCPGCCNPEMWNAAGGREVASTEVLAQIEAARPGIEGITLLGGEPFQQDQALAPLAQATRALGLTVMTFSGYTWEELQARASPLLAETDLLVAGRYLREQRTAKRRWIGSENQTLHFLSAAYRPEDPRFHEPNHAELRLGSNGDLVVVGFPFESIMAAFPKPPPRRAPLA